METITSTRQGDVYISDVITSTGNDMAIHVELQVEGDAVLQRSLDGNKWFDSTYLFRKADLFEVTVRGFVSGQKVRLKTTSQPTLIQYLQ